MQIYLSQEQANRIGEKFMDLGNLALAGMAISQLLSSVSFNLPIAILGVFSLIFAYSMAYYVMRGGKF